MSYDDWLTTPPPMESAEEPEEVPWCEDCGGDLCVCGAETMACACGGAARMDEDDN